MRPTNSKPSVTIIRITITAKPTGCSVDIDCSVFSSVRAVSMRLNPIYFALPFINILEMAEKSLFYVKKENGKWGQST